MLRFFHPIFGAVLLYFTCCPAATYAQAPPLEPGLQSVVNAYVAGYHAKDINRLISLWSADSAQLDRWRGRTAEFFDGEDSIEADRVSVREVSGADDSRTMIFEMQVGLRPKVRMPYSGPMTVKLDFIRREDEWKIRGAEAPVADFAATLASAKASDRDAILNANPTSVTVELVQNLLDLSTRPFDDGKLAQALEINHLAHSIATGLGFKPGQADALRNSAIALHAQGKSQEAIKYLDQSLALATQIADPFRTAAATHSQAVVVNDLGETAKAFGMYNHALEISRAAGDEEGVARALLSIGAIEQRRGNFQEAVQHSKQALAIFEKLENKRGALPALYNLGMFYGRQDQYAEGVEYHNRGLRLAREIGDRTQIAKNLLGLGSIAYFRGAFSEALNYYDQALAIANSLESQLLILQARGNLGVVFRAQGNTALALEHYLAALALAEHLKNKSSISSALNTIAGVYSDLGNYEQAIDYFRRASEIASQLENHSAVALALQNIGTAYQHLNNYGRALEYYRRSLEITERLDRKADTARTLGNICEAQAAAGSYDQALEMCFRAKAIQEQIQNREGLGLVLGTIAEAYALQNRHQQAVEYAENAANILKSAGDQRSYLQACRIAGQSYIALGHFEKAREWLQYAIDAVENLRGQTAGSIEDRERFLEDKIESYLSMVAVLVHEGETSSALEYAERAKARSLVDTLNEDRVQPSGVMSAEERSQEQSLRRKMTALNRRVFQTAASDPAFPRLKSDLQKARLELSAFQTILYNSHSELRLQRGETAPAALQDAASLLKDGKTALLEYAVAQDRTWLFVVTGAAKPNVRIYPIRIKKDDLARRIEEFRRTVANHDWAFRDSARSLYDLLLAPASLQLRGKTNLIVVPDGPMWELPMQALVAPSGSYVIEDVVLSYAPSLTCLRDIRNRQRKPRAAQELLAMGNPALSGSASGRVKSIYSGVDLGPLPEAEREVTSIAQIYGPAHSVAQSGSNAREDVWKRQAGNYRILHLATHGILDDSNPLYSRVLLSATGSSPGDDGFLEAWEVMQLKLNADLVVLSACESGRGRVGSGEGMIGLSWAFLVAGASTAVVSQWRIESARSADFMVAFHRNLHDSKSSPGEALRQAALGMLKTEYSHPFYWAPFVAVGSTGAPR